MSRKRLDPVHRVFDEWHMLGDEGKRRFADMQAVAARLEDKELPGSRAPRKPRTKKPETPAQAFERKTGMLPLEKGTYDSAIEKAGRA